MSRNAWSGIVLPTIFLWVIHATSIISSQFIYGLKWWIYIMLGVKLIIELIAIFYMMCFLFSCITYLLQKTDKSSNISVGTNLAPAAVLYTCCNDLEPDALLSLSMLEYPGELKIIVHDDSQDPQEQDHVNRICEKVRRRSGRTILLLRRPSHEGGKPGAIQYVLEQTHHLYDFFLLADNDSYADSPDVLTKAISRFDHEKIAVVQCRNRTRQIKEDGPFAKTLSWGIDIFDIFMKGFITSFWSIFVGHNAVLRTSAVMEVGGMTPGFFADDIDLSVRLQDQGYVIRYCPDIELSETHPRNYLAFCIRTSKWATGCMQVLREHTGRVLRSKHFSLLQKIGFFLFCGFYLFQVAVFLYLIMICLIEPFIFPSSSLNITSSFLIGAFLPLIVFGPASVYLLKHHRDHFWSILAVCAAVYGSTDFYVIQGLLKGLIGKHSWIPTNCVGSNDQTLFKWVSYILGLMMLLIPLKQAPLMLLVPTTVLFASKFLFVPAIANHYREVPVESTLFNKNNRRYKLSPVLSGILVFIFIISLDFNNSISSTTIREPVTIEIRGDQFVINDKKFEIRGIHYGPWRPGSSPGNGPSPTEEEIRQDLELIVQANANTILCFDPSVRLLELADQYGLKVIYALHIDWWKVSQEKQLELVQQVEAAVSKHKNAPALFAWMLGNEMPEWVISKTGAEAIRKTFKTLSNHVRSIDSRHPITYGDWPMARNLNLAASLDFVSFNLYPYYPPEVAAAGFGQYIERELKPIAKGRPLLISEFGINTLETSPEGQAETLRRCWGELQRTGIAGGIVFEFSDQWWKNFDNPTRPPNWWEREKDLNDHLKHDNDPEEYYGIVTSDREPKPAYEAVRKMFADTEHSVGNSSNNASSITALIIFVCVVGISIFTYRRRRH